MPPSPFESRIVLLLGAVQFVNILDFVMVMPLGPDFALDLGISTAALGQVGGAYTASAAVAGLVGAGLLDRLDRRTALLLTMVGLFVGTVAGGLAWGLGSLLAARVLAGMFGGPASATALAILSDVIPAERRGAALGKVMGAFSVASIAGVPAGLELSRIGGWRLPFFVVAALGLVVAALARLWLPSMRGHLDQRDPARRSPSLLSVLRVPGVLPAAAMVGCGSLAGFSVIPNFATWFQINMGFPRAWFGGLYLIGGVASLGILRAGGRAVDKLGGFVVAALATAVVSFGVAATFLLPEAGVPVVVLFVTFMAGMSLRNVAMQTLATRVPPPEVRAGFLSLQSTSQHAFAALGAILSSFLLTTRPDGGLVGAEGPAWLSLAVSLLLLVPVALVQARVGGRLFPRVR